MRNKPFLSPVVILLCVILSGCSDAPRWDDQARMEKEAKQDFMGHLQDQGYSEERAWSEWQKQRSFKQTMGYEVGEDVRE